MIPEEFIKNNPFPKDGEEINKRLITEIQDPSKIAFKKKNLYKLFKNNARLIFMIFHQYNYGQTLGSTMSFVYEGIAKATDTFDPTIGTKFYQYAVQTIRGVLQNYYNYNNDLIHIPVMKRKKLNKSTNTEVGIKHEYCDINDYSESQYQQISNLDDSEENDLSSELTMLLTEYENLPNISSEVREEIKIFKMAREYTLRDISYETGINTMRLRKMLDSIILKLRKYYMKIRKDLY